MITNRSRVADAVSRLHEAGIFVSLFIDPSKDQIALAKELSAEAVELHTGSYADAASDALRLEQLEILKSASEFTKTSGLHLHAGHGLTYSNVLPIAAIDGMEELNIGHSIIARSMFVGMQTAVEQMKALCIQGARG